MKGGIVNEGINIVDSSSSANQYQVSISPPTATTNSKIQTIRQGFNYNQVLDQPRGNAMLNPYLGYEADENEIKTILDEQFCF